LTPREIKDVSASVRQLLGNKARAENRQFDELLRYYAIERFLYRLSKSPYSAQFVLKGALMLGAPSEFPEVIKDISEFLAPLFRALQSQGALEDTWLAGWRSVGTADWLS